MKTYTVLVIGDKPEEQMELFNCNAKVDKYIKYYINDAKSIYDKTIKTIELFLKTNGENERLSSYLDDIKEMTEIEYFSSITEGLDHDAEGNALDDSNPRGKWSKFTSGGSFSTPLITIDDKETFQTINGNVNWNKMHLFNEELYSNTWELIVNGKEPINENDIKILSTMKSHKDYLLSFCTKENYITYNTSYWNYAVIKDGVWIDMENKNSSEWIKNFYNTFIESLDNNTLLTIYEYNINDL